MFIKLTRVCGTELIPMIINTDDITAIVESNDNRNTWKSRVYLNTKNPRLETTITVMEDFNLLRYNLTTQLSEVPHAK